MDSTLPIFLFVLAALAGPAGMIVAGRLIGPSRQGRVKAMPYESGMDPIHDAHRRFDVRFNLVAVAFLVFDVELLFLYPWAVASRDANGIDAAVAAAMSAGVGLTRGLGFGEALGFLALFGAGVVYGRRRG